MMRIRAAFPAALLLLGGCITVPSGIVDNFVPPQGQTVVAEVKTPLCTDAVTGTKGDTPSVTSTPCTTEVITIAAAPPPAAVPNAFHRNRPRPPRMPGRR